MVPRTHPLVSCRPPWRLVNHGPFPDLSTPACPRGAPAHRGPGRAAASGLPKPRCRVCVLAGMGGGGDAPKLGTNGHCFFALRLEVAAQIPGEKRAGESATPGRAARAALTFTLPPESGPNSAILLNILSHGRSRRCQRKRPGPAGSPLPSQTRSSRAGAGGGFPAEGRRVTAARGAQQPPTRPGGRRP